MVKEMEKELWFKTPIECTKVNGETTLKKAKGIRNSQTTVFTRAISLPESQVE